VRSVWARACTGKAGIEPAADKAAQARQAQGGLPARRWQEGAKQAGTACRRFVDLRYHHHRAGHQSESNGLSELNHSTIGSAAVKMGHTAQRKLVGGREGVVATWA
jgi:hypothetical protein